VKRGIPEAAKYHSPDREAHGSRDRALKFVLLIGVLSLFADFTYQGSRSVLGPYLGTLSASASVIAQRATAAVLGVPGGRSTGGSRLRRLSPDRV